MKYLRPKKIMKFLPHYLRAAVLAFKSLILRVSILLGFVDDSSGIHGGDRGIFLLGRIRRSGRRSLQKLKQNVTLLYKCQRYGNSVQLI